jgi:hypothetical protein
MEWIKWILIALWYGLPQLPAWLNRPMACLCVNLPWCCLPQLPAWLR